MVISLAQCLTLGRVKLYIENGGLTFNQHRDIYNSGSYSKISESSGTLNFWIGGDAMAPIQVTNAGSTFLKISHGTNVLPGNVFQGQAYFDSSDNNLVMAVLGNLKINASAGNASENVYPDYAFINSEMTRLIFFPTITLSTVYCGLLVQLPTTSNPNGSEYHSPSYSRVAVDISNNNSVYFVNNIGTINGIVGLGFYETQISTQLLFCVAFKNSVSLGLFDYIDVRSALNSYLLDIT